MNSDDPQYDPSKDPKNWFLGVFYFNKNDTRLLPPKRNPVMGWTVNFANPLSVLILVGILVLIMLLSKIA